MVLCSTMTIAQQTTNHKKPITVKFNELTKDEQRAVLSAEMFVLSNGYTDSLVTDTSKLVLESVEFASNRNELLNFRHGMLQKNAYGIRKGGKGTKTGWTVIFQYSDEFLKELKMAKQGKPVGRAISIDSSYSNISVGHKDSFLETVGKKLQDNAVRH